MQISQLALAQNSRPQGTLSSNTEVNPIEQCNNIILRCGKKLEERSLAEPAIPQMNEEPMVEKKRLEEALKKPSTVPYVSTSILYLQWLKQGKLDR